MKTSFAWQAEENSPWITCDKIQSVSLETRSHHPLTAIFLAMFLRSEGRPDGNPAAGNTGGSPHVARRIKREMTLYDR